MLPAGAGDVSVGGVEEKESLREGWELNSEHGGICCAAYPSFMK